MKKLRTFISGFLAGALLFGGISVYAAGVMAEKSRNRFLVNGQETALEAYMIDGSNYFKLRDLGEVLGFGVAWDENNRCVIIDTSVTELQDIPAENKAAEAESGEPERIIPKAGDVIVCSDGFKYEITDVSMYDNSMFASGPLGDLPKPTCDWSRMPEAELPKEEARHYNIGGKEHLFVRNLYETKRMLYTLYNAIGNNEETFKDGELVPFPSGNPKVTISLEIPEGEDYYCFWPWRAGEIENYFNSCPPGHYRMQAFDHYIDGKYVYTEYGFISD